MTDLEDLAAPYVMGSLEPDERSRFEAHLLGCAVCTKLVADLADGVTELDMALAVTPPPELKARVVSAVGAESGDSVVPIRGRRPAWWRLASVAAAVVVVLFGGFALLNPDPLAEVMTAADARSLELAVHEAFAAPPPPHAQVIFSPMEEAAAVEFAGLAQPGEGTTYQLWLIGDGDPLPAGVFVPDEEGAATVLLQGEAHAGHQVAITEEPAGGLPAPTGEVLFSAQL